MRYGFALILALAVVSGDPARAQSAATPGVTEVAPGVREIDGAKVPTTQLTASRLKTAIETDKSFKNISKMFDVKGIASPGPSGTTTYMYKMHDAETGADVVVILFVKGNEIVDFLIT
jgi:hypothetical protein